MPSIRLTERTVLVGVGILAVVSLLYSILIMQAVDRWVQFTLVLVVVYLLWRLVRAVERIAETLESDRT
ncbi:MAG: hypothetical protein PPP58_10080 [Natronomonas sp.]